MRSSPNTDVAAWGLVGRLLSNMQRVLEGSAAVVRTGAYGETVAEILGSKQHKLNDEGSYYIVRTPTPGTGVASIAAPTAYVATSPYLIVTNNNPAGGKNIWLDYINLNMVTPSTSSTNLSFTTALDAISRYSSGGSGGGGTNLATVLQGPVPPNSGAPSGGSSALVYAGALVALAASPQNRILCNRLLRSVIAVAGDTYLISFGATDIGIDAVSAATATLVQRNIPHPPVCIAPGGSFLLHLYGAAAAAATTAEVEIGYVER